MAKVYFKVRTKLSHPESDVSIRVRFKDANVDQIAKTGEVVKLRHWNLEKQEFRKTTFPGKDRLVGRLRQLKEHIHNWAEQSSEKKAGWLLDVVDRFRYPEKHETRVVDDFFIWSARHVANLNIKQQSIAKYNIVLKRLREFDPDLDWQHINYQFYDRYIAFLQQRGLAKNTIADHVKAIKAICKAGALHKVNRYDDYLQFKKETEDSDNVYLNESEINRIYRANLSRHPHLEKTRDLFVIACWVGCRHSDLGKIRQETVKNGLIYFKQTKTKDPVVIPIHPVVREIFDKYNWVLPKTIANQPFNREVKLIAKAASLRQKETVGKTVGGVYSEVKYEKWELVSSHTARRSFASNLFKEGVSEITIMNMTGHRTQAAFLKYIKVSKEQQAEMLAKFWNEKYEC
ncbi:site-specific integrase [Mangrovibacterium lignilyticum]|uniref:site-specific integrase n=1 Tax=Mangrovibacterium lignilyticum TaxID=2668052 RepID=UPI0013D0B460|nr:site-specific integrase [Mangrovibacterium lignilyticum]